MTSLDHLQIDPNIGLHSFPYFFPNKWILMGAILCGAICLYSSLRLISEGEFYSEGDQCGFLTKDFLSVPVAAIYERYVWDGHKG